MNIVSIIPARMGSSRFFGKPMEKILGIPMIGHVYMRTRLNKSLSDVYVATCDKEIYDYIESIGGKAIMTSNCHERCSDRCAEAMLKIEDIIGGKCDIMVMVQGDEPLTFPQMIDEAIAPMISDESIVITNLMADMQTLADFENPNEVKVVVDKNSNALYLSREPIPSRKKGVLSVPMKKQVCVIPFRRDFLLQYSSMEPTPLEIIESVDMMRVLENGIPLKMVQTAFITKAIDTPEDKIVVENMMQYDKLIHKYI